MTRYLCPVCGYRMEDPPRDYNICPSCGTEFGYHDENASITELRATWLRNGLQWWSPVDPQPENWDPYEQVAEVISSLFWIRTQRHAGSFLGTLAGERAPEREAKAAMPLAGMIPAWGNQNVPPPSKVMGNPRQQAA